MDQYFLRRSGEDSDRYSLFDRKREGTCVLSDQPWPVAYQEYLRLNQENDLASSSSSSSEERYYTSVESIYDPGLWSVFDRQRKDAHGDDACVSSRIPWEQAQRGCYELNRIEWMLRLTRADAEIQRLRVALAAIATMGDSWPKSSAYAMAGSMQDCARAALLEEGR